MDPGPTPRPGLAVLLTYVMIAASLSGCARTATDGPSSRVDTPPPAATTLFAGPSSTAPTTSAAPRPSAPAATESTRVSRCRTSQLTAALGAGAGGGAGHQYPVLVLTNNGGSACTVRGYPGVSFVGNGNGTQLGAAATREAGGITITTLTLAAGAAAHAQLNITMAGSYDAATCKPKPADGLRIYPPDETQSVFVATTTYTACQNASVRLIVVRPLQAGAA